MADPDMAETILEYQEARRQLAVSNGVAITWTDRHPDAMTEAQLLASSYFAQQWKTRGKF